jgi:hypothetical protein
VETVLFVLAVAAAGLACPAMMWWQRRRGRDAACCVPVQRPDSATSGEQPDLEELRRRRDDLAVRIAESEDRPAERPATPSAS